MSSSVPKIITCTENKDLEGVKSCIENGYYARDGIVNDMLF